MIFWGDFLEKAPHAPLKILIHWAWLRAIRYYKPAEITQHKGAILQFCRTGNAFEIRAALLGPLTQAAAWVAPPTESLPISLDS